MSKFEELPINDRNEVLSSAINGAQARLETEELTYEEQLAVLQDLAALTVAREAGFLERQGVHHDVAMPLAERILGEGIKIGRWAAAATIPEAPLRRQAREFDFDSLLG